MEKDIRWAIKEVMSKSRNNLKKTGMWDFDKGEFRPVTSYKLSFDSQQNQLEPTYYWFLDFMGGWKPKKVVDNFTASPGSQQFQEVGRNIGTMQDRFDKMSAGLNQVVKSVLNLVYDLKEFELRLSHYDDYNNKEDVRKKDEGAMALKQIWLDNVDLKRGLGSIHRMSAELGYSTLREAFMMANSVDDLHKMNRDDKAEGGGGIINDQVMRILIPRMNEFLKWADYSEKELRKRFSIEKNYLKSQVETIKLYSAWMKPYLEAAENLRQKGFEKDAALVNAFSTTMFELQLFGKKGVSVGDVYNGNYKEKRGYNQVVVVGMTFRGHNSQRVTQKGDYGFVYGGKTDMTFDAYALNDEELAAAEALFEKAGVDQGLEYSLDIAGEALSELKKDLDYFLMSKDEKAAAEAEELGVRNKEVGNQDINPFAALFGLASRENRKSKIENREKVVLKAEEIAKDNYVEGMMREGAVAGVTDGIYSIYDIYKKAHGMASSSTEFDADV
ncbi:MAG: hypothetical protein KJ592_02595 [Nanoarchaeota archaeon]|nr:hypothetical protein [Nanoarchaeota archaeon]